MFIKEEEKKIVEMTNETIKKPLTLLCWKKSLFYFLLFHLTFKIKPEWNPDLPIGPKYPKIWRREASFVTRGKID